MGLMSLSAYRLLRSPTDAPIPNTSTNTGPAVNRVKNGMQREERKRGPISPVLDQELKAALGEVGQAGTLVVALTTRLSGPRSPLQIRHNQQITHPHLPSNPARRRIHQKPQFVPSLWLTGQ